MNKKRRKYELVSHMSNTKWRTLLPRMAEIARSINVRSVSLQEESGWTSIYIIPVDGYFEPLPLGPIAFSDIEWIMLKPSNSEEAEDILCSSRAAFTREGHCFKIWGYSTGPIDHG